MLDFEQLTMLNAEDIEYDSLCDETLQKLVLKQNDLFIATYAFGELWQRESSLTSQIANRILVENLGDRHLRAQAFSILYQCSKPLALEKMKSLLDDEDDVVLAAILEMVYMDIDFFKSDVERFSLASKLAKLLAKRQDEKYCNPVEMKLIIETFKM